MLRSIRKIPFRVQQAKHSFLEGYLESSLGTTGKFSSFEAISGNASKSVSSGGLTFYSREIIGHLTEASAICANGGSVVHSTVSSARNVSPTDDFLPLTVDYRSRAYAFGRMPQSSGRRERHGSDDEVLVARIIDRAIRPLFPKGYVNEVQVTVTAHAADGVNDPTIAAVNATSFALMKSKQPWNGPIGCVRVGLIDGKLVVDPSVEDMEKSEMDLVYAGNMSRPLMIETVANQVTEDILKKAMRLAQAAVQNIIEAQVELLRGTSAVTSSVTVIPDTAAASKDSLLLGAEQSPQQLQLNITDNLQPMIAAESVIEVPSEVLRKYGGFAVPAGLSDAAEAIGLSEAVQLFRDTAAGKLQKADRGRAEGMLATKLKNALAADTQWGQEHLVVRNMVVDAVLAKALRAVALEGERVDGRKSTEVRQITCSADVLPSVHGSAFFQRGDTHVLCTTTLGPRRDAKTFWPILGGPEKTDNFYLHYDFPPYCTGETGNATATNRRMVGHGNLAERALRPVMPDHTAFPYAVRVFAECTSSNGSSSMASACGATLSLMDAGVPIKAPVAGVSVGLVTAEDISSLFPVIKPLLRTPSSSRHTAAPAALIKEEAAANVVLAATNNSDASTSNRTSNIIREAEAEASHAKPSYVLLTDIIGTEDHYGDMDFKVAGTAKGITAVQLDVKLQDGVPGIILEEALDRAREGRLQILEKITSAIPKARSSVKLTAPRAEVVKFDPERKGHLVGRGGEMLRFIEEEYQCEVDLSEEGVAYIFGKDETNVKDARMLVQDLVAVIKEGDVFTAEVIDVKDFGAVVNIARAQEALLHVSELTHDSTLLKKPITDLLAVGQRIDVQVIMVDMTMGLVKVSRKKLIDPLNQDQDSLTAKAPEPRVHKVTRGTSTGAVVGPGGMPVFPTNPPRRWSKEYFRNGVATKDDIASAVAGNNQYVSAGNTSSSKKQQGQRETNSSRGGKDNKSSSSDRGGGRERGRDGGKERRGDRDDDKRRDKDRRGGGDGGDRGKNERVKRSINTTSTITTTNSASTSTTSSSTGSNKAALPLESTAAASIDINTEDLLSIGFQRSLDATVESHSSPSSPSSTPVETKEATPTSIASTTISSIDGDSIDTVIDSSTDMDTADTAAGAVKTKKRHVMIDSRGSTPMPSITEYRELAAKFGTVKYLNAPVQPSTMRSKGFAFVEYSNADEAASAIAGLDGYLFRGKNILKAVLAKGPKSPRGSASKANGTSADSGGKDSAATATAGAGASSSRRRIGISSLDDLIAEAEYIEADENGVYANINTDTSISTTSTTTSSANMRRRSSSLAEESLLNSKLGADMFHDATSPGVLVGNEDAGNLKDVFEMREEALKRMRIEDGDVDTIIDGGSRPAPVSSHYRQQPQQQQVLRDVTEEVLVPILDGLDASPLPAPSTTAAAVVPPRNAATAAAIATTAVSVTSHQSLVAPHEKRSTVFPPTDQDPFLSTSSSRSSPSSSSAAPTPLDVWQKEMEEFNSLVVDVPTPLDK